MKTEWVEYSQGGMKLKAYMAYDDKITGKRPAVLVVHAREGMTPKTQQLTELWAKLGYVSFAADIFGYGQGILPKDVPEMTAQTQIFRKDPALTKARTQAGYDTLIKNPMVDVSKVGLVGYCFGGDVGIVFGSTGAPLTLNVSIHGSFGDYEQGWAKNAKGMFLILHGAEDQGYPLTKVNTVVDDSARRQGSFQARGLQRHRPWLLEPEGQGRGARQRAVDRDHLAHHEGTVRYLIDVSAEARQ